MTDRCEAIKSAVTMPDLVRFYGLRPNHANKIICPFHTDKRSSCHIYKNNYHCFSCGAHGDVIDFVAGYFAIPFSAAMERINTDFNLGLPIGKGASREARKKAEKAARERRERIERRRKRLEALQAEYDAALFAYTELDQMVIEGHPSRHDGALTEQYTYAIQRIDAAAYRLDCALCALQIAEKETG